MTIDMLTFPARACCVRTPGGVALHECLDLGNIACDRRTVCQEQTKSKTDTALKFGALHLRDAGPATYGDPYKAVCRPVIEQP